MSLHLSNATLLEITCRGSNLDFSQADLGAQFILLVLSQSELPRPIP